MMLVLQGVFLVLLHSALAVPAASIDFLTTKRASSPNLPTVDLPYGTYRATTYDADKDIYAFKNIRFAAAPVGNLRWARPAPPNKVDTVQDGSQGGTCYQSLPPAMISVAFNGLAPAPQSDGSFFGNTIANLVTYGLPKMKGLVETFPSLLGVIANAAKSVDIGKALGGGATSEDCLFLDVYVPGSALRNQTTKLPVVNYIYGGAYIIGEKDGMYDGTSLVKQSNNSIIVVVGNYRLGFFGFLAGPEVEKAGGVSNAGFWDQRAVMSWIQQNIGLLGGDKDNVSLWGESAGAGSIMHHLVAFGGKEPALFKKAVIQSPANRPQWDRNGAVAQQFRDFATLAGCSGQGLSCLRGKSTQAIVDAGNQIINNAPEAEFGFGPAVDGVISRQLPDLELASGNFLKEIESIIVTHVSHEGDAFVPSYLKDNTTFFDYGVRYMWGSDPKIYKAITAQYPPSRVITRGIVGAGASKYEDEQQRMIEYLSTQLFACHVRTIAQAYQDRVYVGQYSRGDGKHGRDIQGTFYNSALQAPLDDPTFPQFAATYEDYLISHAKTGVPKGPVEWPKVRFGPKMENVMDCGNNGFKLIEDNIATEGNCGLWLNVYAAVTAKGGYTPVDGVVTSDLI